MNTRKEDKAEWKLQREFYSRMVAASRGQVSEFMKQNPASVESHCERLLGQKAKA
jgi:hypothetical protein